MSEKEESTLDESLFVSDKAIMREVELGDGKKHKFWFREAPAVEFRRFQIAEHSQDEAVRATSMFRLIAASVCEPDGRLSLTVERAQNLRSSVTSKIMAEILAINQMGVAAKNVLPPEVKSGSGKRSR